MLHSLHPPRSVDALSVRSVVLANLLAIALWVFSPSFAGGSPIIGSLTNQAVTSAFGDVKIAATQRVLAGAVSLSGVDGRRTDASQDVLSVSNCFKVAYIHARMVSAKMVYSEFPRQLTVGLLVDPTSGTNGFLFAVLNDTELSVPIFVTSSKPHMAFGVWVNSVLLSEPLHGWTWGAAKSSSSHALNVVTNAGVVNA